MATPSPTGASANTNISTSSSTALDYSRDGEGEVEAAAIPRTAVDVDDTDFEDNEEEGQLQSSAVGESLDLTGTLEEVNQILGIAPAATAGGAAAAAAAAGTVSAAAADTDAAAAAAAPPADAHNRTSSADMDETAPSASTATTTPTTAAVAKLTAARQKAAAAAVETSLSSEMDYSQSYDYTSYADDEEDDDDLEPEVGIEVQLEEPSLEVGGNEAESTMGGISAIGSIASGIVIQESTREEKKALPVKEEEKGEEEDDEVCKIKAENERLRKSNETLEAKVENVELREINETLQAKLDAKRRASQTMTMAAEPVQTATEADADEAAAAPTRSEDPIVTPEAVAAASGAAVAAAVVAAPAATPSDANAANANTAADADAGAAPPAQKGLGLGVSKFADEAGNALDEFSSFVNTMTASVTEAVQPGLDSVRKTLNFGTASPSPPATGEDGGSSVVAGAAAAVAAVAGVAVAAVAGAGAGAASVDKDKTSDQTADRTATDAVVTPAVAPAVTPDAPIAAAPSTDGDNDTSFGSKASGAAKTLLAAFNCASNDTTDPKKEAEDGQQAVEMSPSSISLLESPSALTSTTKAKEESPSPLTSAAKAKEDAATARFLKEITEEGIVLLLHQAPNPNGSNPTSDWTQKIVRVYMKPGSGGAVQPKLVWARNKSLPLTRNKTGGIPEAEAGEKKIRWTSLDLLGIHSIMGAADGDKPTDPAAETEERKDEAEEKDKEDKEEKEEAGDADAESGEGEQSCFFTVTSGKGSVFVFEAMTPEERDRVSKGLQSVITGLAHALITGDVDKYVALVKDARDEEAEEEGELPSLRTPAQAMNDIAHSLLD